MLFSFGKITASLESPSTLKAKVEDRSVKAVNLQMSFTKTAPPAQTVG